MGRIAAVAFILTSLLVPCALAGKYVDVTANSLYRMFAEACVPTLLHELGENYYPCAWDCDGDRNPENNPGTYSQRCPRTVYVHIIQDPGWGYLFVQYWYYYAYNPCPPELIGFVTSRVPPVYWPLSVPVDLGIAAYIDHPQDWELAMVVMRPQGEPVALFLGAHGQLYEYEWTAVGKDQLRPSHPFAYAYQGSHAMSVTPDLISRWYFGVETWSGGRVYTPWEETAIVFLGSMSSLPATFGGFPSPWERSIWKDIPDPLDGACY